MAKVCLASKQREERECRRGLAQIQEALREAETSARATWEKTEQVVSEQEQHAEKLEEGKAGLRLELAEQQSLFRSLTAVRCEAVEILRASQGCSEEMEHGNAESLRSIGGNNASPESGRQWANTW